MRPPSPVRRIAAVTALTLASTWSAMALAQNASTLASKYYDNALQRYEKQDLQGAAVQLKNALQQDKSMLAAHLLLGRVLLSAGQIKAAEAALEEALRRGVSVAEVAPMLGQVYLQLSEPRKLLDTITTANIPTALQPDILTLRGSAQAMLGNLTAATALFAQARQLAPTNALPLIAEAPLLLRAGEREAARSAALKATELAPKNAIAWYQLGAIQQSLGDRKSALASLEKALALEPKLVDAQVSKASLLLVQGQTKEAGELLTRLKAEKVVEPRASFLRATIAEAAGNPKQAAAEYAEAANLIDALPPGIRGGSEPLLLAGVLSHRSLGNLQRAREYTDLILARNPRHAAASVIKASLLLEENEVNRAVVLLENLLRVMPDDPQVLYMMGSVHMGKRQYAQASEMFERASRAGAGSAATRELALSQLGLGQDKSALGNLEQAYAKNPRDYRAGIELAVFHARRGQGAKAVGIAQALVDLDPKNPAMLNFLGNIKGRLRDNAGMRTAYEGALAADPKFKPTVMNISMLDMDEGRFDAARARLSAWLKNNESDTEVLYLLGNLEQRARRLPTAIALWSKADGLQNRDPRPGLSAVDALLALRKSTEALAAARTLAGKYPDAVPVQLALARAQLATGDITQARLTLSSASKASGFDVPSLVSTARIQLAIGETDGAAHAAGKALKAAPDDVSTLVLQAEVAGKRGDAAGVDAAMKALTAKHPNKVPTLLTAGHVAMSRRQYPQAIAQYTAAHQREPGTPTALMLTQAYLASNQADKALALMEATSAKQPTDMVARRALAELQGLQGKTAAAKQTFAQLVAAEPNDAELLMSYAQLLQSTNDPAALSTADKAAKLDPTNVDLAATLGVMMAKAGQTDSAVRVLRDARLRVPGNGAIRWELANVLAQAGRKAEARDELQAALVSGNPPPPGPALDKLKRDVGL